MSLKLYNESYVSSIADALRSKVPIAYKIVSASNIGSTRTATYNQTVATDLPFSVDITYDSLVNYRFSAELLCTSCTAYVRVVVNSTNYDGNSISGTSSGTSGTSTCIFTVPNNSTVTYQIVTTSNNRFGGTCNITSEILEQEVFQTFTIKDMAPAINQYNNYYLKDLYENNITFINLPEVTKLTNNAVFQGCTNLSMALFPNVSGTVGNSYFQYCTNLKEIYLPKVTVINGSAFASCYNLSSVYAPLVSMIGSSAFIECSKLTTFLPFEPFSPVSSSLYIYSFAFSGTGLTKFNPMVSIASIGAGVFNKCSNLSLVSLPNYTSYVPAYFCQYCPNLTNVYIPNATYISSNAFRSCPALTTINLNSRTSIGSYCFESNTNLSSINFPSVSVIYNYRFKDCSSLTSVNLPICTSIYAGGFQYCRGLSSIYLPSCNMIDNYGFYWCSLETISIPSIVSIGAWAFAYCFYLKSFIVNNPTEIKSAFQSCSALSIVDFGTYSSIIYPSTFAGCYNLLDLYLRGSCQLSNVNAFYSTPISNYTTSTGGVYGRIHVPASLLTAYKTATNWATYSSRFVGDL